MGEKVLSIIGLVTEGSATRFGATNPTMIRISPVGLGLFSSKLRNIVHCVLENYGCMISHSVTAVLKRCEL